VKITEQDRASEGQAEASKSVYINRKQRGKRGKKKRIKSQAQGKGKRLQTANHS